MSSQAWDAIGSLSSAKNQQAVTEASRTNGTGYFSPLVAPSQNFLDGGAWRSLAHFLDLPHRPQGVLTTAVRMRLQVGDRFAVPSNHDRLAALDIVQQLGELCFGLRGLDLLYIIFGPVNLTGQYIQPDVQATSGQVLQACSKLVGEEGIAVRLIAKGEQRLGDGRESFDLHHWVGNAARCP